MVGDEMTRVSFQLGAEADLVSKDEFDAGIGSLSNLLRPSPKDRSLRRNTMDSGVMPAAGPLLLNLGGAPAGSLWVPLTIVVTGADDHTVVAASQLAVYFGGQPSLNPMLSQLLIPGATAPMIPYWQQIGGKDAIYGHFGDSLFVLVYGVAAGTNLQAAARIREIQPASLEEIDLL